MHALLLVYLDWFPIAPLLCANLDRDYFVVEEMDIKLGRDGVRRPVQPQVVSPAAGMRTCSICMGWERSTPGISIIELKMAHTWKLSASMQTIAGLTSPAACCLTGEIPHHAPAGPEMTHCSPHPIAAA